MTYVLVHHEVLDYGKWKKVFDAEGPELKVGGCEGFQLFKDDRNPLDVTVIAKFDRVENAHRFFETDRIADAMKRGGVKGRPEIYYLQSLEKKDASDLTAKIKVA